MVYLVVFFPLFFVLKKNYFIFDSKKRVWQPKMNKKKKKTIFKTQFVKETENMQNVVFIF